MSKGARYTAWIEAHTRYGIGKAAQATTATESSLGPVRLLKAELDGKVQNLVKLTWTPPSGSSGIQVSDFFLLEYCPLRVRNTRN